MQKQCAGAPAGAESDEQRRKAAAFRRSQQQTLKRLPPAPPALTLVPDCRWCNVLDPSIKRDEWAEHELRILFEAQQELGNVRAARVSTRNTRPLCSRGMAPSSLFLRQKWSEIAKRLPGRPEAAVKNTFYSSQRRARRRLQRYVHAGNADETMKRSYLVGADKLESCVSVGVPSLRGGSGGACARPLFPTPAAVSGGSWPGRGCRLPAHAKHGLDACTTPQATCCPTPCTGSARTAHQT